MTGSAVETIEAVKRAVTTSKQDAQLGEFINRLEAAGWTVVGGYFIKQCFGVTISINFIVGGVYLKAQNSLVNKSAIIAQDHEAAFSRLEHDLALTSGTILNLLLNLADSAAATPTRRSHLND